MIPLKTSQFYFLYMFSDSQNVQYIDNTNIYTVRGWPVIYRPELQLSVLVSKIDI